MPDRRSLDEILQRLGQRLGPEGVQDPQRASAGLILSDGIQPNVVGTSNPGAAGLRTLAERLACVKEPASLST